MAQLLLTGTSLSSSSNLDEALLLLEARLAAWASNTEAYNALLLEVFGAQSSDATTAALQASLSGSGLRISLEILDGTTAGGINGAYTSAAPEGGEAIYLNADWLQNATAVEIEAVLLEELGHPIDTRLNGAADTPGDEGEIFSALLRGLTPATSALTENDQQLISLNGITVAIEAAADTTPPTGSLGSYASAPAYSAPATNPFGISDVGFRASPALADLDGDGDLDLFIGERDGNTLVFTNTAFTPLAPVASTTAGGTYGIGDVITLTVGFSEEVFVDTTGGTPQLQLETGDVDRFATYSSGSGTDTLSFTYTVQAGDTSADLDQLSSSALPLNGGTIADAAGNSAILTLAAPGAAGSLGANAALVIDGIAPEAPSFAPASDTGSSNSDGITSDGTILVTGLEAAGSWQYSINSGSDWLTGTGNSFTLPEATYASGSIQVRQSDAAGNSSATAVNTTAITVDTTAPSSTPTLATITEGAGGAVVADGGTSTGTAPLVLSGTLSAPLAQDESVRIFAGTTDLGGASLLPGNASWTFTDRRPLVAGQTVPYTAQVIDRAGNQSPNSAPYSVTQTSTPPVISVQDVSVVEGELGTSKQAVFTIALSRVSDQPISLTYEFLPGTATVTTDYTAASGPQILTINPGVASRTIAFTVIGDSIPESDETLSLQLSNPSGATFAAGSISAITATGTIINDDIAEIDPDQGVTITSSGNFSGTGKNDQLTGDGGANQIQGLAGNDIITGLGGADVLSGGSGADTFRYTAFTESTLSAMDWLTDFNGTHGDKLELPTSPTALYNRGTIGANSLAAALQQAYTDKDTSIAGNQPLLINEAVLFTWGTTSRRRNTYLSVSDGNNANFNGDFLAKLPASPGSITLSTFI